MRPSASLVSLPLAGEAQTPPPDDLTLDTLPGKFTLTRTDAALTAYGGLVAWNAFLKRLGIIERCAERCPIARTSPNAAPVREVVHSFALSALAKVPGPLWEGAPTLGCQQLAETTLKLHGWSRERRVVIVRTLKPANPTSQDEF